MQTALPVCFTRSPVFLLWRAQDKASQACEKLTLKLLNTTVREVWVLQTAVKEGQLNQQAIAEILGINPNTMVTLVDGLERKGFVQRRRNPKNRKEQILHVTSKGAACLEKANDLKETTIKDCLSPLTGDDVEALCVLLAKYIASTP